MKRKEIKNLAKKIYQQELILQNPNSSSKEKQQAEIEIIRLSGCVNNINDMMQLDEAIQDLLLKNS